MVTILIPAHNEGAVISETLESLKHQTLSDAQRVIVLADNCTDDTADVARSAGAEVFETVGNIHKKAGALNQWFDQHLADMDENDLVMVMDADSALEPDFLRNAILYIYRGYHAVGGVFLGKEGGGFVGWAQRNEFARYGRDVARRGGKTLVLTGTATVFTAKCLQDVVRGRTSGKIPGASTTPGEQSHVYDTKALTEDNELTFALLHLGYKIIAPAECGLKTEVMESWGALWKQRFRWKRGAIENNWHYGFTRHTAKYWGLQLWGILGIVATSLYLYSLVASVVLGQLHWYPLWMAVTAIYILERAVTVARHRGMKQALIAACLVVEMPYDLFLQAVHSYALATSVLRTRTSW